MTRAQVLRFAAIMALLSLGLAGAAQTQSNTPQKSQPAAKQQPAATHPNHQNQSAGEKIFAQNCARCHTPPDGFSPRISGTVVLHMRVRANLSERDTQELMRYFNP